MKGEEKKNEYPTPSRKSVRASYIWFIVVMIFMLVFCALFLSSASAEASCTAGGGTTAGDTFSSSVSIGAGGLNGASTNGSGCVSIGAAAAAKNNGATAAGAHSAVDVNYGVALRSSQADGRIRPLRARRSVGGGETGGLEHRARRGRQILRRRLDRQQRTYAAARRRRGGLIGHRRGEHRAAQKRERAEQRDDKRTPESVAQKITKDIHRRGRRAFPPKAGILPSIARAACGPPFLLPRGGGTGGRTLFSV